jgi:hypothetical protein
MTTNFDYLKREVEIYNERQRLWKQAALSAVAFWGVCDRCQLCSLLHFWLDALRLPHPLHHPNPIRGAILVAGTCRAPLKGAQGLQQLLHEADVADFS